MTTARWIIIANKNSLSKIELGLEESNLQEIKGSFQKTFLVEKAKGPIVTPHLNKKIWFRS
jgi:hypothetical protein